MRSSCLIFCLTLSVHALWMHALHDEESQKIWRLPTMHLYPQCISVSCVLKLLVKSSIEIAQMRIHLRHKSYVLRHILLWLPKLWPSQGQTIDAFTWQFSESRWKISTAWSTEMLNAFCQPVTEGHTWHLIFVSLLFFVMGEWHVHNTSVLQAVVWSHVWHMRLHNL